MKHFIKPDLFTTIVSIVCIVGIVFLIMTIEPALLSYAIILFIIFVTAYFVIKMPIYSYVDKDKIIIKQLVGGKTFNRDSIYTQKISYKDLKGTIRLFGSGGFCGYIGWFSNSTLGKFYMIASNKKDLLLITTVSGKKYVINCPL
ncbi:MAG: PH domain-containing protein [Prevotellaceae bacterium]|jgi:hypothetical protein|nr:PH domain-containing protein [Prevotellaceae bacterium]